MAEIGFFIDILLGFPGPSDGLRLHSIVFFSSGSGLTADSSVLTLTLAFLDFGLDFAQSFPFHAQNNNIHRRPDSAVHHTGDDYVLGNLKFVPKGESVEVFGMAIPDPLITEAIRQSSYYPMYLKMVAENTKKTPRESASVQPATKRATPKKPTTTTPVKQTKPAPPPSKKPSKYLTESYKGKACFPTYCRRR
ncbi:hypothetical protein Tco_1147143 [Tanacetum coccineum]